MAEDGAELGSIEGVRRILAARLDEPHPVGHLVVLACEQPRGCSSMDGEGSTIVTS